MTTARKFTAAEMIEKARVEIEHQKDMGYGEDDMLVRWLRYKISQYEAMPPDAIYDIAENQSVC